MKEAVSKMNNIVYFEINNWFAGRDYPDKEPFISWLGDDINQQFWDDNWCKKNKLCVTYELIDMSQNFKVTATYDWVKENCPCILEKEYARFVYNLNESDYDDEDTEFYEDFRYGSGPFLKWCEHNFGCHEYNNEEGGWYEF